MKDFFDFNDEGKERCDGCKHCRTVHCNGGYEFYGCYHTPYRGKWVATIKDCPIATDRAE